MKKAFVLIVIFSSLYSADIRSLPSSITLTAGQQRQDTAISQPGNGTMTTFYARNNGAVFTLNGGIGSKYTLEADNRATMFSINSLNLGQNANFDINQFHTLAIYKTISLGANSTLNVTNSGTIMSAGGTEYGGDSKIRFDGAASLNLGANSSATFNRILFFIHEGDVSLAENSTLSMTQVLRAIRFEKSLTNNGGSILLGSTQYQARVYNVGFNSIANFTQNSGSVEIIGDFYNGGEVSEADDAVDKTGSVIGFNVYDTPYSGGGNLIINGGTMTISRSLVSRGGGGLNSTIQLYGGTLIVGGGLQNKEGSTLIFGIGNNGAMGKLQGNLTNDKGQVVVDTKGVSVGQSYQIITGSATGLDNTNIGFINGSDFFDITYSNGSVTIKEASSGGGGSGGGGGGGTNPPTPTPPPTKIEVFKESLNANEKGLFNAFSSKFGGDTRFLLDSGFSTEQAVREVITTTEKVLKESYIAQPQNMINALQASALPMPVPKSVAVARRTAASELIRFDNGKRVSPFERKIVRVPKRRSVYFTPLGAILRADNLKGYIAGFTLGTSYEQRNFTSQIYLAYAYGASSQDFTTQSADTTGNLFQAGFLNRYSYSVFEMSMNANLLAGVFKIKNEWQERSEVLNSTANFGDYQLNLGLIAGAKLGKRLSFKPFVGIQNYVEMREKFKQNGGLGIESKGYNAYIIDGVLGVEGRYVFSEFASVFGKFSFEERLYNTHKEFFMWAFNNELKYDNASYDNALSLNLGTQIYTWYDFNLDAELLYKRYNNGLNYFGGNLILKYAF